MEPLGERVACELGSSPVGEPGINHAKTPFQLVWFDYWLLFGAGIAALFGIYLWVFGFRIAPDGFALVYFGASPVYAALTAVIAATVPRRAGLPVLPILENWWVECLNIRKIGHPIIVAIAVGSIVPCAAIYYDHELIKRLGSAGSTSHVAPNVLGLVCTAVLEEILFRGALFAMFATFLRWAWDRLFPNATLIPVWIANVLQAGLFGAAHIAVGRGVLKERPWYIRTLLISQTWSGLVLGCVYWRYGIESAILCHTTFDLVLQHRWAKSPGCYTFEPGGVDAGSQGLFLQVRRQRYAG